jgi:hypothetical protein
VKVVDSRLGTQSANAGTDAQANAIATAIFFKMISS